MGQPSTSHALQPKITILKRPKGPEKEVNQPKTSNPTVQQRKVYVNPKSESRRPGRTLGSTESVRLSNDETFQPTQKLSVDLANESCIAKRLRSRKEAVSENPKTTDSSSSPTIEETSEDESEKETEEESADFDIPIFLVRYLVVILVIQKGEEEISPSLLVFNK